MASFNCRAKSTAVTEIYGVSTIFASSTPQRFPAGEMRLARTARPIQQKGIVTVSHLANTDRMATSSNRFSGPIRNSRKLGPWSLVGPPELSVAQPEMGALMTPSNTENQSLKNEPRGPRSKRTAKPWIVAFLGQENEAKGPFFLCPGK